MGGKRFPDNFLNNFTFSSHTEYVKTESIVIAGMKKKNSLHLMNDDDLLNDVVALELKTSKKMASV